MSTTTSRNVSANNTAVLKVWRVESGRIRLSIWEKPVGTTDESEDVEVAWITLDKAQLKT